MDNRDVSVNANLSIDGGQLTTGGEINLADRVTVNYPASSGDLTCWDYWRDYHYPHVTNCYPVYIQERAKDKGKQAFEIIKIRY